MMLLLQYPVHRLYGEKKYNMEVRLKYNMKVRLSLFSGFFSIAG